MRAAGAALALALAAACADGGLRARPRHVLLVVLDATHAAELGCYGGDADLTPNLDGLAAAGVRFARAFSNTTWTLPSTASLLTGRLQERHGVVTNEHRAPEELELLPEVFARHGWRTAGFVQMVYASGAYGLDQGFEHYVYRGHDAEPGALIAETRAWLREHADEDTFTYLHLRRPHSPYDPRPQDAIDWVGPWPFDGWEPPIRASHADVAGERPMEDRDRDGALYLYRANLATVDRQLAGLFEEWAGRDDSLVVVTSDHGEGFGQHGFFGHGGRLWAEVIDIPLIVSGFGLAAREDHEPACTVDVAPTLLELCGLGAFAAGPGDGRSLSDRLRGGGPVEPRAIPISARYVSGREEPPEVGVVRGARKVVLEASGEVRVHDRAADPGELAPLAEADPALVQLARELLDEGLARAEEIGDAAELDEELLDELRALGYGD